MRTLHCRPAGSAPSEIRVGSGARHLLAERLDAWRAEHRRARRAFLLIDQLVADRCEDFDDPRWQLHASAGGEAIKTLAAAEAVLSAMVDAGLDRSSLLVAAGGGSIGDLGGFCAALFLRGIECWQVPTTLLAMVDSAVGGKTAVNLPQGKNLIGAVHPPALVLADLDFLTSLPQNEFDSGLAEAIKAGIGLDAELFELLERDRKRILAREPGILTEVVERSLRAKIAVVERDLSETGDRRLLNLGHTLGHALEAHRDHRLAHGLCVARGIHFAIDRAVAMGRLDSAAAGRCRALLAAYGHERTPLPPAGKLRTFLARDKKAQGATIHFVLPTAIGASSTAPIELDDLLCGAGWQ